MHVHILQLYTTIYRISDLLMLARVVLKTANVSITLFCKAFLALTFPEERQVARAARYFSSFNQPNC